MSLFAWVGGRTFASLRNHRNFRLYFFSHAVVLRHVDAADRRVLARARADRLAGWLTAQGGTKLAFAVAGTSAVLVAVAGTAVLFGLKPRPTRIEGELNADHA